MHTKTSRDDESNKVTDILDLSIILRKAKAGLIRTLGLVLLFTAVGTSFGVIVNLLTTRTSTMRVSFSFPGLEKGQYPDGSKFSPDDLRAPDVVAEALKLRKSGVQNRSLADIRAGITVTGIVPANVIKERDRIRASGQNPPVFIPDEYAVSFGITGRKLSSVDRENFLHDLGDAYLHRFKRTYVAFPPQFGKAFDSLSGADFFEYDLILSQDLRMLENLFTNLTEPNDQNNPRETLRSAAATFRSPTTGYSFTELLLQTQTFMNIKLTEVMGVIEGAGISKDRQLAVQKMNYRIGLLSEKEIRLSQEESMLRELMYKTDARNQSYVLGIKSDAVSDRKESPLVDAGLIDTLVRNDSFNYLVRRAVEIGTRTREVGAEKTELIDKLSRMQKSIATDKEPQAVAITKVTGVLQSLQLEYDKLMSTAKKTYEDYTEQQLSDAVRITAPPDTKILAVELIPSAALGAFIGLMLGLAISLLLPERDIQT